MHYNANKALEVGRDHALTPPAGITVEPPSDGVSASTLTEGNDSAKTGQAATPGLHANDGQVANARVDGSGHVLTTNHGVSIADNQHSLKAGLRGPLLLEDFILRKKSLTSITSASLNALFMHAGRQRTATSRRTTH